ncbi:hypothetical protein Ccrd_012369 [Cynara cardunculus var. scolymus]|uniref:Arfaptin homology (AH) domain/BAR domain-containing protein n=1 Tax=Cynara cardunculus var. scolymus TaxID=59895 RepID=A0A103YHM0_CYNCS|nr:hypothetical protein Ccrd_012369 [Cynara cardunculus var. scolymus]
MKSSLEKFGRKLTMHKNDGKEKRDHQPSALLDDVVQASKDMQDIRNCYDGLISAAAAMTNSIFESLHEMGTCLLDKTTSDADGESGRVLSTLGNIQSELQKISDIYRSYVIVTITNPSESLLSELRKVEEMKLQCDEKREAYEYMVSQNKEKGKLRSGKAEIAHKLEEAQDEYNTLARLCAFRVKSLKEGQCRSLLTQATRHHAAQLDFFRKGFKVLEAVDPVIRIVAEKHRIEYQLSKLDNGNAGQSEGINIYDSIDEAGLNPLDIPDSEVPKLEDREINHYKHQREQVFGRQTQNPTSYSAPLYPDFVDSSERPRETRRKVYSYVLPPPVDTKSPVSRTPTSVTQTNPFHNIQPPLPVDHEKQERDFGNNNTSTPTSTSKPRSSIKNSNGINPSIQLPSPSGERFRRDTHSAFDSKVDKRQAYSGPLPPTKPFSGKIAPTNGPVSSTELPLMRRSVSPQPLSSPKINELHELPRPPSSLSFSKPGVSPGGASAPSFFKNQDINKTPSAAAAAASPLPPPPLVVPRSFSIHSSNPSAMVPKRIESPQITVGKREEVSSPPLSPILLSNRKSTGHI